MAKAIRIPQINLNRTVAKGTARSLKVNPSNPMTKGQARLLFFAVKELTGERLDLFSVNTPALVHSDITELCGILKKDSGATQDEQQIAIEILCNDLRVPVLESTTKPASSAGRSAAKKAAAAAITVEAGKVGIVNGKLAEVAQKMTPAQSLAKARAGKKAKAAAVAAVTVPAVEDSAVTVVQSDSDRKLALLVEGLATLIKAVA